MRNPFYKFLPLVTKNSRLTFLCLLLVSFLFTSLGFTQDCRPELFLRILGNDLNYILTKIKIETHTKPHSRWRHYSKEDQYIENKANFKSRPEDLKANPRWTKVKTPPHRKSAGGTIFDYIRNFFKNNPEKNYTYASFMQEGKADAGTRARAKKALKDYYNGTVRVRELHPEKSWLDISNELVDRVLGHLEAEAVHFDVHGFRNGTLYIVINSETGNHPINRYAKHYSAHTNGALIVFNPGSTKHMSAQGGMWFGSMRGQNHMELGLKTFLELNWKGEVIIHESTHGVRDHQRQKRKASPYLGLVSEIKPKENQSSKPKKQKSKVSLVGKDLAYMEADGKIPGIDPKSPYSKSATFEEMDTFTRGLRVTLDILISDSKLLKKSVRFMSQKKIILLDLLGQIRTLHNLSNSFKNIAKMHSKN